MLQMELLTIIAVALSSHILKKYKKGNIMKKEMILGNILPKLPEAIRDGINRLAKEAGQNVDELKLERSLHKEKAKINEIEEGTRQAKKYVSTRTIDKDGEIIHPKGIITREFEKSMAFFWGHNYSLPPLGSDKWVKSDKWGLQVLSEYGDTGEGTMADVVWRLVKQGHQKASSIGFVPLEWVTQEDKGKWQDVVGKLAGEWEEFTPKAAKDCSRIITKCLLLEHSDVGIASNNDTAVISVAKSFGADEAMLKHLGFKETAPVTPEDIEVKGNIPYLNLGNAEKGAEWNGPREVAKSEIEVLKKICTWFSDTAPEMKSSYKLPHHFASDLKASWRGVVAAMGALLGARGGVEMPQDAKNASYQHLSKHYKDFDQEPPAQRDYSLSELKSMFHELYYVPTIIPVKQTERIIRVVGNSPVNTVQDIDKIISEVLYLRRGGI
jgi:hypothetical protein